MIAPIPLPGATKPSSLSYRQEQILKLICEGLSSKQMADRLGLSIKTIEMHRTRLHARLGTRNAQQVIRKAARWTDDGQAGSGEKNCCARLNNILHRTALASAQ